MKEANFLQQLCCEKTHTLLPLSNVSNSEFLHKQKIPFWTEECCFAFVTFSMAKNTTAGEHYKKSLEISYFV